MTRAWFFNIPYHGHINPTLPLVRALVEGGDEVTYFAGPAFEERVCATGACYRGYANLDVFGQSRNDNHMIHQGALVAESTNAVLGEVLDAVGKERPDYLLFDMSAPWANIAARRYDIPAIACFPHLPFYWRTVTDDPRVLRKAGAGIRPGLGHWRELRRQLNRLAGDHKLRKPADINVLSSSAELNIAFLTRYYQPYEEHFDSTYVYVGPTVETDRLAEPFTFERSEEQTLIYIAVGTLYRANVEFFQACMAAFSDPKYAVVLSIGKAVEPEELGHIPQNFTVAQFVPQLRVLQEADLFITHGGMNSINEAVTFSVPMVVVPNTIEQAINASRIEQLKCGIYLDQARLSVESLRAAAAKVLTTPATSSGLSLLLDSFREAGGTQLAVDSIEVFKQRHDL